MAIAPLALRRDRPQVGLNRASNPAPPYVSHRCRSIHG
ncbi:hypothetical protein GLE_3420 [Lysobacter enzymogenes]|uniref:Uncharacterized protein n=1 Tax=Lysobacter enzymogenes TaxID=69 RepID=A0A0S2DJR2_LYSEN|nr:hypothetical protein GLE_3420 [Lysobacter enzymogenes]